MEIPAKKRDPFTQSKEAVCGDFRAWYRVETVKAVPRGRLVRARLEIATKALQVPTFNAVIALDSSKWSREDRSEWVNRLNERYAAHYWRHLGTELGFMPGLRLAQAIDSAIPPI